MTTTRVGMPGAHIPCRPLWAPRAAPAPTQGTLVHVLAAGWPCVPRGAGADGFAVDRVRVTVGTLVARVTDAGIIQVAKQTWGQGRRLAHTGPGTWEESPPWPQKAKLCSPVRPWGHSQ